MKKCDYFKDLILTDYIDAQMDKSAAESIEGHLLDCGDCRAFFKEVKNNAAIFSASGSANVLHQPVPAELWSAVKQGIEQKNQAGNPLAGFIDQLKGFLVFPKLVPVFASFIVMFLAGSVTLNTIQVQQAKDRDQGEYLVALLNPASSSTVSDSNDGDTPIEHYFL